MSLHDTFKVALVPLDIVKADVEANLRTLNGHILALPEPVDLIVVPELFSTGFINDPSQATALAEDIDGDTVTSLKQMAAKYNAAICGSFLSSTGANLYNRGFFIEPDGETAFYDKRHLFCLSKESKICTAGTKPSPIVRFRGWNLAMAICYDVRFPVWLRNVDNRYDALIIPANWPDKREFAWRHLLQARAIENMAYVVATNRSGCDDFGCYDDLTFVYDYMGQPIGRYCEGTVVATLNRDALRTFRDSFPAWRDADTFRLNTD